MHKYLFSLIFCLFILSFLFLLPSAHAQAGLEIAGQEAFKPQEIYDKGTVIQIEKEGTKTIGGERNFFQTVKIQLDTKKNITTTYGGIIKIDPKQKLKTGDSVVVLSSTLPGQSPKYSIVDRYRLTPLFFLVVGFFILVIAFAGRRGIGSLIGMLISLGVIMQFIVPQILGGADPLLISIIGAVIIMITTIYLSHGFSRQTSVAIFSTFLSLVITGLLAVYFVDVLSLSGTGNEENALLAFGNTYINIQGLLLGGIIIGTLGILDDTTTTQAAAVFEFYRINPKLSTEHLLQKGLNLGKEHIAALVNTLVLAYAGVSLSLFIFFVVNPGNQPYWVIFNSESIIEEIVRTLAGSIGLILAVPITTLLAVFVVTKMKQ
jgi:uncharacterized membrane protein